MTPTTKKTISKLTPRDIAIVNEYLGNQKAGKAKAYQKITGSKAKPKTLTVLAGKFFKRPEVEAFIEKRRKEVAATTGVTYEYLVMQQRAVLERCMQITPVKDKKGEVAGRFEFNSTGANRAIETLGKLTGAFEVDNKQKGEATGDAFGRLLDGLAGATHKPGEF